MGISLHHHSMLWFKPRCNPLKLLACLHVYYNHPYHLSTYIWVICCSFLLTTSAMLVPIGVRPKTVFAFSGCCAKHWGNRSIMFLRASHMHICPKCSSSFDAMSRGVGRSSFQTQMTNHPNEGRPSFLVSYGTLHVQTDILVSIIV